MTPRGSPSSAPGCPTRVATTRIRACRCPRCSGAEGAVTGYLFDRKEGDQERLIRSSETLGVLTTEACRRAGLGAGGRAIDIGCGPLGGLAALAALVGAEGEVVGLDASAEALALAREGLRRRGYSRIELVRADLDTATLATFGESQPFDLAYIRRFLVHQADPAASLIRIARLLRPGGRIVAHEIPPATGYPRLTPMVPTLRRVDDLVHAAVKARGGTHDVANRFGALCDTAGLRLIEQRGVVPAVEPIELLETFQAVLRALGPGAIAQGVTTPDEVESMLRGLEAAKSGQYVSAFGNLYIEMVAEAP